MTKEEKRLLQTCGKGWFIIMMAETHDNFEVTVDLTQYSTYKTRLRAYEKLHGSRKRILRELVEDARWSKLIGFAKVDQPNEWYLNIAKSTLAKIYNY